MPPFVIAHRGDSARRPENTLASFASALEAGAEIVEFDVHLTRDGHVRPTMRGKYTQINEFLKQLLHCLDAAGLRTLGRDVVILDCGCGSSYLTLALHHYLNDVLQIPARIHGNGVGTIVASASQERRVREDGIDHQRKAPVVLRHAKADPALAAHHI